MSPLTYGPDTPQWAILLFEQLRQRLDDQPARPMKLWQVTTAKLPPAASWTGCMAFNTSLGVPVMSDGSFWYPVTVGAHL